MSVAAWAAIAGPPPEDHLPPPPSPPPPTQPVNCSGETTRLSLTSLRPSLPRPHLTTSLPPSPAPHEEHRRRLLHRTLVVENIHHTRRLKNLLTHLSDGGAATPLRLIEEDDDGGVATPLHLMEEVDDGGGDDWSSEELWAAAGFLIFDEWRRRRSPGRATAANFSRLARLLCGGGAMEEAGSVFRQMAALDLPVPVSVYNSLVDGLAGDGDLAGAGEALRRMPELGLSPSPETFHGLLRAFGRKGMYDEMRLPPNASTFNLLIMEFAGGGLLEKMEATHRTLLSRRMKLLPAAVAAMIQAYAEVGNLEKMEKMYRRFSGCRAPLREDLIRKMALVYIQNYRFARLEEFGNEIASRTGRNRRTHLVWRLLLLAAALLLSRRGMESIAGEMKAAEVTPHITFTNSIALAHAKMKDFRDLEALLSKIGEEDGGELRPDLVTVGVLFDACSDGFNGGRVLDIWRRRRFLEQSAVMETDPLVIAAFGKGRFIKSCEEAFFSTVGGGEEGSRKAWTYVDLIRLVFHGGKLRSYLGKTTTATIIH
ncbi:unnamed protein product [Spirodela intermedia]|uniref:Uncharacterized protein n=1 Tax=Spirodela intermedia TaxID=51605 RepID=A0A7I8JDF9_SPIIN|nr:unnamed protein product [Spirodela intermedia]CAA6668198.1 unnamed protein product [Spirodela intermedia]